MLQIPASRNASQTMRMVETADGWMMTNLSPLQRGAGITLMLAFGVPGLGMLALLILGLVLEGVDGTQPHSASDLVGVLVIALLTLGLPTALVLALLRLFRVHRRSLVHVDMARRTCSCRNKVLGFTTERVEVDFVEADWQLADSQTVLPERRGGSTAGCIASLLLLLLGPIGVILGLVMYSRGSRTNQPGQEAVKLMLMRGAEPCAVVTLTQEQLVEDFLVRWDREVQMGRRG